ncbi:signal transduction histidine kinase [Hydrogenispora ethanolica]|jgi:signal transduction histidine kinase|uniref:histidine kinase n=1 Tax=Hydrogenispora ethanolica TaxID=1082276 RepID=A0A4V2QCZ6_HYDET|nr:HAMP domain-containing sensor histidine kinase [Hydrogenispora ethanolica]TCL61887.1 signal transduction histidine kinase [Hydrogenispora ethanolica]
MIILLTILIVAAIALFIVKAKNPSAYWMALMLVGWFLSMAGLILFFSKYGGFYYHVNLVLFLDDRIRQLLLTSPISIDWISRLITVGRSIFIFSLTGLSLRLFYNRPFSEIWSKYVFNAVLPLANLWFYDPLVYRSMLGLMERNATFVISLITRAWVIGSTVIALAVMVWRYRRMSIPWAKSRLKHILLGVFSLVAFYFYLAFLGPLQVTDARTYYFLYWDFSNFNPPLTTLDWYIGIGFTGFTSIWSIFAIWKYTEVQEQFGKPDLLLARKLKTANMGVRVFTHGMKNQLLMTQLLVDQTRQMARSEAAPAAEAVVQNLDKIGEIVGQTLSRLDLLYQSFKTSSLELRPLSNEELLQQTLRRIKAVPEHIRLESRLDDHCLLLADEFHLSETLANIVINALEAIPADRPGQVTIRCYVEDRWCVIRVSDNGAGIAKEQLQQIFDPFFSSKNSTKNWGVGLSYAKQIVQGHFGHILVKSQVGQGSQFDIFLPVYSVGS